MNFEFSEEQHLLRQQAQTFLRDKASPAHVRAILDGEESFDQALWRDMAELGWTATTIPETFGGLGLSHLELCVLAEELGRSLAPTPFSSSVYLATEALLLYGNKTQQQRYLPALASGELIACYAVAEGPKPVTPANLATRVHHGALSGAKVPVADGDVADMAIVLAHDGSGHASLFISDLRGDGVTRTRVETLDPARSHAELTFEQAPIERLGDDGQGWRHNEALFDRAAVLFAFEQVGLPSNGPSRGTCSMASLRHPPKRS